MNCTYFRYLLKNAAYVRRLWAGIVRKRDVPDGKPTLYLVESPPRLPESGELVVRQTQALNLSLFTQARLDVVVALLARAKLLATDRAARLEPNMAVAYRAVAFPSAIIAAAIVFVGSSYMEIRSYRQSKTLAGIEQQMGS